MASCPYTKSESWQNLVKEVGEMQAYALFVENDYKIPTDLNNLKTEEEKHWSNDKQETVTSIKNITKLRNQMLNAMVTRANMFENNEKYYQEMLDIIEGFIEADIEVGVDSFVSNGINSVKSAIARLEKQGAPSADDIRNTNDFVGMFSMIDDLISTIQTSPLFKGEDYDKLKDNISILKGDIARFKAQYTASARIHLTDILANASTRRRYDRKEELSKEFRKLNPPNRWKGNAQSYKAAKLKYIKDGLDESVEDIKLAERAYISQLLSTHPDDISKLTAWVVDPRNINDHILQLTVKVLENAEHMSNQDFIKQERDAVLFWEKWMKTQKKGAVITDQKDLYEGVIEKINGQETNYYVRKLYSTYYKSKNDMLREVDKLTKEDKENEAKAIKAAWKKENLINPNLTGEDAYRAVNAKPEHVNPQFENMSDDQAKMYKFLIDFNKQSDEYVADNLKLGYRLPSIDKTFSERITDNKIEKPSDVWDLTKRLIKEQVSVVESDTEFGDLSEEGGKVSALSDSKGKPLQRVALPFRMGTEVKNQSFDLMGMALSNRAASLNYYHKTLIQSDLEMLKNVVADRDVTVTRNGKKVMVKAKNFLQITGKEEIELEATMKGEDTNLFEILSSVIDQRLYGRESIPISVLGGRLSMDKVSKSLIKFSSDNMLIANALGSTANMLNGQVMNFFESTKYNHFGTNDLGKAHIKYLNPANLTAIIEDIDSLAPKAKTNLLFDKFLDSSASFNPMINQLTNDKRYKRVLQKKTLHGLNSSAEHYIQGVLVYSMMNNIKVMKNGGYIDKDGNPTNDRSAAMTMDEAYTKNDRGLLEWGNSEWTIEGYDKFNRTVEAEIRAKIKDVTADLQGQYDDKNKALVERYWHGKLGLFLRKWMIRGTMNRWRGVNKSFTDVADLEDHERFYSEAQQGIKEGSYATLFRYMVSVGKRIKTHKAEVFSANWNDLSDYERGNIRMAMAETTMILATLAASNFLAKMAGEDDDESYLGAYFMRRIYSELIFYTPLSPFEAARFLRTPSATLSTLELQFRLWAQLQSDMFGGIEYYQRGEHKGESKSYVLLNKAFNPIYKNALTRDVEKSFNFLANNVTN